MITVPLLHPRKTYWHTPLESTFTLRCHLWVQSRQMFAQEPVVCHSHRTLLNGVHASYRLLREEYAMDTGDMCSLRRRYEITSHYATTLLLSSCHKCRRNRELYPEFNLSIRTRPKRFVSPRLLFTERVFLVVSRGLSGSGGLEVACWPLVPKFAGSHPAEAVGFLGRKNPQHAFLLRGSKAVGPM